MSKPLLPEKSSLAEKLKGRIGIFVLGAFCLGYGIVQLRAQGPYVYYSHRGLPVYPGGVIALGILLLVLAFVPAGKWLEKLTTIKKRKTRPH
ncbi:MAG TPA: hypothetical protein VFR84_00720 [Candidatus Angelobacter sp.]|nr:hypothetical protein [Candidatus Angelobacter sp.]